MAQIYPEQTFRKKPKNEVRPQLFFLHWLKPRTSTVR